MPASTGNRLIQGLIRNPLLIFLIVIVVVVQVTTGSLLNWQNMRGVLMDGAVIAIVAIPCAMLIIAGYIDLSVGSTLALGGVVGGMVMSSGLENPALAVIAAIGAGALVGLFNGILTCRFGLSAFITTLGTLTAVRGVAQLLSPLPRNSFGEAFGFLGVGTLVGIPVSVWIAGILLVVAGLFLARTPAGRHVYAIGVNREAAYLSGVNVSRIPFLLFILSVGDAVLAG